MNHLEFYEIKRNSLTSSSFPTQLPSDDLLNDMCVLLVLFYRHMNVFVCMSVCACVCVSLQILG